MRNINIHVYFLDTGFDVSPALPGRRSTVHDFFPIGSGRFLFDDPGTGEDVP